MREAAEPDTSSKPRMTRLPPYSKSLLVRSCFVLLLATLNRLPTSAATNPPGPHATSPTGWVRAGITTNAAVWGRQGGLQFALHPSGFADRNGGPRGLIRIGYPTLSGGRYDLINFIAVEPVVKGKRGYSELEKSTFDGKSGKLFWVGAPNPPKESPAVNPGEITVPAPGIEQLNLPVWIEPFENGAHVRLRLIQRSDKPDEVALTVEAEAYSAPIEMCILTATMGNKARARLLSLSDGLVSSLQLWPDYRDSQFSPTRIFAGERLPRTVNGDVLVAIINDEEDPSSVQPIGRSHFWDYKGGKVTQYWKERAAECSRDLTCAVNGRFVYWGSKQPVPGGIAFENFELREPFRNGQTFVFGISRRALAINNEP